MEWKRRGGEGGLRGRGKKIQKEPERVWRMDGGGKMGHAKGGKIYVLDQTVALEKM